MMKNMKLLFLFFSISLLLIAVAHAADGHEGHSHSGKPKCECSHEDDHENKAGAQKYKIAAIPSVLIAGVIGVLFPLLGKVFPSLRPETSFFFVTKAFAAGVILSTGFMHVLPEAYTMLNSPCLTSEAWEFPFTGFIAMVAAIFTLSVDTFATSSFYKSHSKASRRITDGEDGGGGGGGVEESGDSSAKIQILRTRVIAQVCWAPRLNNHSVFYSLNIRNIFLFFSRTLQTETQNVSQMFQMNIKNLIKKCKNQRKRTWKQLDPYTQT